MHQNWTVTCLITVFTLTSLGYIGGFPQALSQGMSAVNTTVVASDDIDRQQEQRNKDIVLAMIEAFNNRNVTALDYLIAEDIVENRPGTGQGIEATKGFLAALMQAFPDFNTKIEDILAEGDLVVIFTNTTGTHEGEFIFAPGTAPTGKQISFRTADLYKIENGKIVEHGDVIDNLDSLIKIGAISFNMP